MTLRREPYLRSENLLQYALDELARLKNTKTRTTDGKNLVIAPPGSSVPGGGTVPAPPEGAPHVLFGSKNTNSLHVTAGTGLNIAYEGSQVWIDGVFYTIAAGTLAMTNAATNYVFVNSVGVVANNTTGFPTVSLPLAIVVTAGGAITSVTDRRAYLNDQGLVSYTDEQAQDAVGTILTDTASIDFTYNDGANTISAVVLAAGVDHGGLGELLDDDHTQYVLRSILTTNGDIFVRLAGIVDRLGVGAHADGEVLTLAGGLPSWASAAAGYSDEQAQDAVGGILTDTAEINLTYDDAGNQITADLINDSVVVGRLHAAASPRLFGRSTAAAGAGEEITIGTGLSLSGGALASTITQYTDEQAQDAVGTILTDTASIDFTYDDAGNTISAVVLAGGVDHGGLGGLLDDDHTQYLLRSIYSADGDMVFRDIGGALVHLAAGTADYVLTMTSGVPAWEPSVGGGGGAPAIAAWARTIIMMGA